MDRWVEVVWSWNSSTGQVGTVAYLNMESGQRSKVTELTMMWGMSVCETSFPSLSLSLSLSFFIFCSLIYSGLGWHRGLDSACCQTKGLQCSQCYSDPVSALSPMRSPQCYVSLTEKYSHAEKDAILQVEALLYWCCTDKGNIHRTHMHACKHTRTHTHTHTHTHTETQKHSHTYTKKGKGAALSPFGIFRVNGILTGAERCLQLFTRKLGHTLSVSFLTVFQSTSSSWGCSEVPFAFSLY